MHIDFILALHKSTIFYISLQENWKIMHSPFKTDVKYYFQQD